jgi:hypothetical protein
MRGDLTSHSESKPPHVDVGRFDLAAPHDPSAGAYWRTTAGESAAAMKRLGFPVPSAATTQTSPPIP